MKRLELVIVSGELSGRRFEVKEGLRLGRSSSNDIHIPDEELSRNHCVFDPSGEAGVRVTDLASANGTLVNGRQVGADGVELRAGDVIEVGRTRLRVEGEAAAGTPPPVAGAVDLGLGAAARQPAPPAPRRRSPLANALWAVAVAVSGVAIWLLLDAPADGPEVSSLAPAAEEQRVVEVRYEKVEATLAGIFRYALLVTGDGRIKVSLDDTAENRHPSIPAKQLDEAAMAELGEIVLSDSLRGLDREYTGAEPDPPALTSWRLKVVTTTQVFETQVVNAQEPEAFRAVREKLEAFSKNELGIHAIQYPRAKLVRFAEEAIALGTAKWEDRDVQYGNLFSSAAAFREAMFYLETVDPKPDCIQVARDGLRRATEELDRRYRDQRFQADRAINLAQWETARKELAVLVEMVPDRRDDRHREASAKLVDVENRIKGEKR